MNEQPGASGLILNEPLLWERGARGRTGLSIPASDVPAADIDPALVGAEVDFPDLSEVDVVRHYTRLSQWNYSVDSGLYPLGSCTMKYNPRTNERQAATPALAAAHPMLSDELGQGALRLLFELQGMLARITGLDAVSHLHQRTLRDAGRLVRALELLQTVDVDARLGRIGLFRGAHDDTRGVHLVNDTAAAGSDRSAGVTGHDAFETRTDERRFGLKERHGLTLHV